MLADFRVNPMQTIVTSGQSRPMRYFKFHSRKPRNNTFVRIIGNKEQIKNVVGCVGPSKNKKQTNKELFNLFRHVIGHACSMNPLHTVYTNHQQGTLLTPCGRNWKYANHGTPLSLEQGCQTQTQTGPTVKTC